ncbi:hypothetical protein QBC37DRAFT_370030 [Rhypophila decipiens]|uniref:RRM domain-containing protein n=1 Tax=Rhypophila decipiens TaxID=261697 RepID=A0AAN6YGN0_9PEZI|nr:hypothetical protein QBC37DRAFT_370030 [Rhypophila decipiens]
MAAGNGKKQVAADFQSFIDESRDRKKNEALAAKIFGKDRRSSTPTSKGLGGSMASRAGITKRTGSQRASSGNVDGEWVHDLHGSNSNRNSPKPSSLASRIHNPNLGPSGNPRQKRQAAKVAEALIRTELLPGSARNRSPMPSPENAGSSFNRGLTIRGLAGPFAVMAQNFAPGTTAADIETAMTPVGGIISRCQIVKTHPFVLAEITFESREGAENVIATFNDQTADGYTLKVYPKAAGASPALTPSSSAPPTGPRNPPTGPRAHRNNNPSPTNDNIVDGTMGFADPMETDDAFPTVNGRQPPKGPKGLYSDGLVRGNANRGGGRGRGRGGRR